MQRIRLVLAVAVAVCLAVPVRAQEASPDRPMLTTAVDCGSGNTCTMKYRPIAYNKGITFKTLSSKEADKEMRDHFNDRTKNIGEWSITGQACHVGGTELAAGTYRFGFVVEEDGSWCLVAMQGEKEALRVKVPLKSHGEEVMAPFLLLSMAPQKDPGTCHLTVMFGSQVNYWFMTGRNAAAGSALTLILVALTLALTGLYYRLRKTEGLV